jgi:hypothetical protein
MSGMSWSSRAKLQSLPRKSAMIWASAVLMSIAPSVAGAHERPNMTPRAKAQVEARVEARVDARVDARVELSQSIRQSDPECYCWANGSRFAHGEQACIKGGGMTRLALCDRVQNVMSWSFSTEPCPES